MSDDGLDVVLTWLDENAQNLVDQAHDDVAQARAVSDDLDSLEARIARIRAELGEEAEPAPLSLVGLPELQRPATGFTATPEWEALRAQAEQSLRSRGVDPSTVDLDALLDPEEVARIARRFIGAFTVRTHLDRYDLAIMLVAGLTAALVDWLVVNGAPTSVEQLRDFRPDQDGLTAFFRDHSVDSDNWLGDLSHASFDQQRSANGATLDGFRPQTPSRPQPGPRPAAGADRRSPRRHERADDDPRHVQRLPTGGRVAGSRSPTPSSAIMIVVAHLLSDAFTPMGIPAPGLDAGQLGRSSASSAPTICPWPT